MKALFLAASENRWLREHGVRAPFVRRAVAKFMPVASAEFPLECILVVPARTIRPSGCSATEVAIVLNVDPAYENAICAFPPAPN